MSLTSRIAGIGAIGSVLFMVLVFVAVRGAATAIVNENVNTYLSAYADVLVPAIRIAEGDVNIDSDSPVITSIPRDWQISLADDVRVRSPNLPMALPVAPAEGRFTATVADRELEVMQRDYQFPSNTTVTVSFALDANAVSAFALGQRERISAEMRPVLMIASGVMAMLLLAQVVAISLPLRAATRAIDALQRGSIPELPNTLPRELDVLAGKVNALLQRNTETLRRYRQFAANLSHAIKTPLTVLRSESGTESCKAAVEQIDRLTERHLKRAQIAGPETVGGARIDVTALVERLAMAYQKLSATPIVVHATPGMTMQADAEDVTEVLGNLVENAQSFASERIEIHLTPGQLRVDDDGPGIASERRAQVLQRGARLDDASEGSGIGLAVSKEIVELYNGALTLTASGLGGLSAVCELPDLRS
ncbi:MAG: ATP-binding protein [Pseudomonadota bacterium]